MEVGCQAESEEALLVGMAPGAALAVPVGVGKVGTWVALAAALAARKAALLEAAEVSKELVTGAAEHGAGEVVEGSALEGAESAAVVDEEAMEMDAQVVESLVDEEAMEMDARVVESLGTMEMDARVVESLGTEEAAMEMDARVVESLGTEEAADKARATAAKMVAETRLAAGEWAALKARVIDPVMEARVIASVMEARVGPVMEASRAAILGEKKVDGAALGVRALAMSLLVYTVVVTAVVAMLVEERVASTAALVAFVGTDTAAEVAEAGVVRGAAKDSEKLGELAAGAEARGKGVASAVAVTMAWAAMSGRGTGNSVVEMRD